jgi:Ribbon-helix-helix protein, copG family
MTPLLPTNFRLESELLDGLREVRERDGIPISEQVRRAIRDWLKGKGVKVKSARPARVKRTGPA